MNLVAAVSLKFLLPIKNFFVPEETWRAFGHVEEADGGDTDPKEIATDFARWAQQADTAGL